VTPARLIEERLGHSLPDSVAVRLEELLLSEAPEDLPARLAELLDRDLDDPLWAPVLKLLLIPKTELFRHRDQLEALADHLAARGPLSLWSAGCATGEEAYSLALSFHGEQVEVLGSDLNQRFLNIARQGRYPRAALEQLPPTRRRGLRELPGGGLEVEAAVRRRVRFAQFNLASQDPSPTPRSGRGWDAILCRNVLIYFSPAARRAALLRLASALAPGGILLLSPAEQAPPDLPLRLTPIGDQVFGYTLTSEGAATREPWVWSPPPGVASPPPTAGAVWPPPPPLQPDPEPSQDAPAARPGLDLAARAEASEERGETAAALELLGEAAAGADLDAEVLWRVGRAYRRLGRSRDAARCLRQALLLDGDRWEAAFQLAGVLLGLGDLEAAEREYTRTLRILESVAADDSLLRHEVPAACRRRLAELRVRRSSE
jgi:chemotaxis protein methyltransferase CheR